MTFKGLFYRKINIQTQLSQPTALISSFVCNPSSEENADTAKTYLNKQIVSRIL